VYPASQRGFSLAEVTIAVGITALGLVALLGLLPQGYDMARKTSQITAESRIVQQITGEYQTGDWTQMATLAAPRNRWYDDQGLETLDSAALGISYIVRVNVPAPDLRLPGAAAAATPEEAVRRVIIQIASNTNPNYAFDDPRRYSTVTAHIAKTN
jgi:uncharacterized protein (TIGR02598 family)